MKVPYIFLLCFMILQITSPSCLTNHQYYDYLSNSCLPCAYNCLTCFDSSICVTCEQSYYLNQITNQCQSCPFGCSICTESTSCTTCLSGLYINSAGQCLGCQNGVSSCSIALIESCSDGYFLLGEICAGCLDNCKSCSDFVTCTTCSIGYYLNSQGSSCQLCSDNCQVCSDSTTCTSCSQGYSLDSSNLCYEEDCSSLLFCKKCSNGVCLECEIGKYASGGSCTQGGSLLCNEAYGEYFTQCETSNYECPEYANVQSDSLTGAEIDVCLPKHSDQYRQYKYLSYSESDCTVGSCSNYFSKSISFNSLKSYYEVEYYINLKLYYSSSHVIQVSADSQNSTIMNQHVIDISNQLSQNLEESGCTGCPYGITIFSGTLALSGISNTSIQISSQNGQFSLIEVIFVLPICQIDKCSACTTANDCESCEDPYYLQLIQCVTQCSAGFYINDKQCVLQCPTDTYPIRSTYQCEGCISPCLTCSSETDCLSCISGYFLEDTTCVLNCSSTTLYQNYENNKCQACPNPCSTCFLNDTTSFNVICLSCNVGYLYDENGTCTYICPSGTYANFVDNITQCSDCDESCTDCHISQSVCTACVSGYLLDQATCFFNYTCPDGYYELNSTNTCEKCHYPCSSCQNDPNFCTSCLKGALYNNTCAIFCPDSMYIDYSNNTQICVNCPSPCVFCTTADFCLSCQNGTFLYQGICYNECPTNQYYESLSSNECLKCIPPCSLCLSQSQCLQCSTGYLDPSSRACTLQCNSTSYVEQNFTCVVCPSPCKSCYTNTSCTECELPYVLNEQSCITNEQCLNLNKYVYYIYDYSTNPSTQISATCKSCTFPCESCSLSAIQCDTCASSYIMVQELSTCVLECPISYFQYSNATSTTCQKCSGNCLTCEISSENCTSCGTGMYLHDYECLLQCPTYYYGNNDDALCYSCELPCEQCYSQYLCKTCQTGILYNKVCVDECPEGSILNQTTNSCDQCTDNCLTCSIQTNNCTDCPNGFYYLNYECLTSCPDTYYDDYYSKNCESCSSPCQTCSSSSSCQSCVSNYYLYENDCLTNCPEGYYADNSSCVSCNLTICRECLISSQNCTQCAAGYYYDSLIQNGCVTNCPSTTYPDTYTLNCKGCPYPCIECTSANICLSCETGYKLYSDFCYSTCPIGYYSTSNDTCEMCETTCEICTDFQTCQKCTDNYYVNMNGTCVQSCEDGYYKGFQSLTNYPKCNACEVGCLRCESVSTCLQCDNSTSTIYLFNGVCLDECPILHYPTSSLVCETCPDYCHSCTNSTYCVSCLNSYIYNNLCYLSCPTYTYPFNEESCYNCSSPCLECTSEYSCETCLTGYLYYQSYCVLSCPDDVWYYPQNSSCSTSCGYNKYVNDIENRLECYMNGCGGMMVNLNGYCLEKCPNNYYVDQSQNCIQCGNNQICNDLFIADLKALRSYNLKLVIHFSEHPQAIDTNKISITFTDVNNNALQYTYSSIKVETYRIIIQFAHKPLSLCTVEVQIPYVQSQSSQQSISDNSLTTNIYTYNNYESYTNNAAVKQIALLFVILLFLLTVINIIGKVSHFLQLMDLMQFLAATLYLQIQYPNILEEYLHSLSNILWSFSPQIQNSLPYTFSPSKYYEYHQDSSLIRNQTLTIIIFFILMTLFTILLLVYHFKQSCREGIVGKLVNRIRYRHLNDSFNIFMLPLLLFSFHFDGKVGDIVMSSIIIIITISFLLVICYKILTVKNGKELPGLLSELQDNESSLAQMYTPFAYIRKIIFAFVLSIQPDKPISTLTLLLILTVLILVCVYFYKPFKNQITDYISTFFQIILLIYVLICILIGLNIFSSSEQAGHIFGIIIVILLSITFAIGIGWLIYLTFNSIKAKCQASETADENKQENDECGENKVRNVQHYESQKVSVKEKKSQEQESANQLFKQQRASIDPFGSSQGSGNDEFRHWGGEQSEQNNGKDEKKENPPTYLVKMEKNPLMIEDI